MAYTSLLDRLGLHRRELRAWALYDVANSAWMTTVMTVVFPLFFVEGRGVRPSRPRMAARASPSPPRLSVVLVGRARPPPGGDRRLPGGKQEAVPGRLRSALGAAATAAMYFIEDGQWAFALATFVVGNVARDLQPGLLQLAAPARSPPDDEVDRVSTAGFALGYLGGGPSWPLNMAMLENPQAFGHRRRRDGGAPVLPERRRVVGALLDPVVPPRPRASPRLEAAETGQEGALRIAARRLLGTFRELRGHKDAALLLLAFLIYNDAVNTIIRMATIYGDEIGISSGNLMLALLMIQLVGVPFAFAFGALADRIGAKRAIFVPWPSMPVVSAYGFALETTRSSSCSASWSPRCKAGPGAVPLALRDTHPRHKAARCSASSGSSTASVGRSARSCSA